MSPISSTLNTSLETEKIYVIDWKSQSYIALSIDIQGYSRYSIFETYTSLDIVPRWSRVRTLSNRDDIATMKLVPGASALKIVVDEFDVGTILFINILQS